MANNTDSNDIILQIDVKYEDAIKNMARYSQEIANLRQQNKDVTAENKELTRQNKELEKQYQSGQITLQQYNQQLSLNNRAINANSQSVEANNLAIDQRTDANRTLRREIQANIRLEREEAGSLNALNAELQLVDKRIDALGDSSSEERDALSERAASLRSQIRELNEARGRMGNFRESILNAIGLNNSFAQSLISLADNAGDTGASLDNFFANAQKKIISFSKTLLALLANPVFLAIAGIAGVGVAFKFWYDYNSGLVEATRLTKQFTGLAGDDLKLFRNEVQGVSDAFGKDFKETLEATNALSKQFGISQQEALQYVKDGFVAGADNNGEFLNTVKEYSTFFNEAGLSAKEFIAITAETAKEGVFSDKGIDSIKEASNRLREMTKATADALDGIGISSKQTQQELQNGSTTTFDVMKKVSEKLNELPPQSKKVGTAIADIFGGAGEDAGLKYLQTLKDIDTDLDSVKDKAGELGEIQERQMNANIELQNTISALFDQTGGTFESMIGNAKVFVTESLTSIIRGLIDIANWFIKMYNDSIGFRVIVEGLVAYWTSLIDIIKAVFQYVIDTAKIVGDALYAAFNLDIQGVINAYERWGENTINIAKGVANSVAENSRKAMDKIQNQKLDPIELPVKMSVTGEGGTKTKTENTKSPLGLSDEAKKAIDAEKKAHIDLIRFRLENEIKGIKEIADNNEKAYEDRIIALAKYNELQKNYIEKDREIQLGQANLTASQKQLIIEKANQKELDLKKEVEEKKLKIVTDAEKREYEITKTNIDNRLAFVKAGSDAELALKLQQLQLERDKELENAEKTGADVFAIKMKYQGLESDERQKQTDYLNQQRQVEFQNEILQLELKNQNSLDMQIRAKQQELASIKQLETETDADFLNRRLTLQSQLSQLDEQFKQHQLELRTQSLDAMAQIAGGFTDLFETIGEQNEALMAISKVTALAEIGFSQASAIAKGISSAQSVPFPANIGAIATTVGAILSAFTQVFKIFKSTSTSSSKGSSSSKKYATGGLVTGAGSGTSDSISAMLSNGESVMTARATSMFSPILSAFNQIGGGVPIQVQETSNQLSGEDMMSRSIAKAVANIPSPKVSVQEINTVNTRVNVLEEDSNL